MELDKKEIEGTRIRKEHVSLYAKGPKKSTRTSK
jgi:hypothetical protein